MPGIQRDLTGRFLSSVFIDGLSLRANPKLIPELTGALVALGMFPLPPTMPVPGLTSRLPILTALDATTNYVLVVQDDRVDCQFNGLLAAERSDRGPDIQQFVVRALELLGSVLNVSARVGHRVALVSEEFATKSRPRSTDVDVVRERLLNIPKAWGPSALTEWSWKYSMRRSDDDEDYNVLATVQSATQTLTNQPIEGLFLQLDVNTAPEQTDLRFGVGALREAFAKLDKMRSIIDRELGDLTGDY